MSPSLFAGRPGARTSPGGLPRLATLACVLSILALPARGQCLAAPGGPPGQCSGPASVGASAPVYAGAGNPLNVITGNKYQREDDMPALPGVLGLELVRHYNSAYSEPRHWNGALGRGWRLSYETELVERAGRIQILQADGTRAMFTRDPRRGDLCSTDDPEAGSLTVAGSGAALRYRWQWPNGRLLVFNELGLLVRIEAPSGEAVTLQYDGARALMRVVDPYGRSLQLNYPGQGAPGFRGAASIDSPVGRFAYQYGAGAGALRPDALAAMLVRVALPDQYEPARAAHALTSRGVTTSTLARRYHHEDARQPWLLTGVSVEAGANAPTVRRVATYGYDAAGKAILSMGAGGAGKVTLAWPEPGVTVLTNALGQTSTYRHGLVNGQYRLHEARGAGCASCAPVNRRYTYNGAGQLMVEEALDARGAVTGGAVLRYDALGRITRVGALAIAGAARQIRWELGFGYSGERRAPAMRVAHSVVPGRHLVTRYTYNGRHQLLSMEETGWRPAVDGTGDAGATPIARRTLFHYVQIGAHSVPRAIDGPLPNGPAGTPADSDVTLFDYGGAAPAGGPHAAALGAFDERSGLLHSITAPGGLVTQIVARDHALRPAAVRSGSAQAPVTLTQAYDWRGKILWRERSAAGLRLRSRYYYDGEGNLVLSVAPGGLRTRHGQDGAGRANGMVLPDGSRLTLERDAEGRPLALSRGQEGGAPDALIRRWHYDDPAALASTLRSLADPGGVVKTFDYDGSGRLARTVDANGTATAFDYDRDGALAATTAAANRALAAQVRFAYDAHGRAVRVTAPGGAATVRAWDDFGRKVMEHDPDRGASVMAYDAGGRLLARADATGAVTRYRHDHAGRLVAAGLDGAPELIGYRYAGAQLVAILAAAGPDGRHAERTEYAHDALGRVVREERVLGAAEAMAATRFTTTYAYDDAGRLVRVGLPDAHTLHYRYAPVVRGRGGQLVSVLFDEQVVVTDIAASVAGGLTGYTMGNGAVLRQRHDRAGRVAAIDVLAPRRAWDALRDVFGKQAPAPLYAQRYQYDRAGRVARRTVGGAAMPAQHTDYAYDARNRLVGESAGAGSATAYRYDANGNRTGQQRSGTAPTTQAWWYGAGTNRLLGGATAQPDGAVAPAAWLVQDSGLPVAQLRWQGQGGAAVRRTVYNSARRPVALYQDGALVARYRYNASGERVAKTVYRRGAEPLTTFSLYRDGRLAAEADASGAITAHYLYLHGKPVARVVMAPNRTALHRLWQRMTGHGRPHISDRLARIHPVVSDLVGTPVAVLGEDGATLWRAQSDAFGNLRAVHAVRDEAGRAYRMDLRLPGQVADAESGLHYNYLRDYDPALGRYLTPDPLGLESGINPYAYVSNNPASQVDVFGLYQTDVHYYMTFFLGVTAGVPVDVARQIALATQYIDDNFPTSPMPHGLSVRSMQENMDALVRYHFVLDPADPPRTVAEQLYRAASFGADTDDYIRRRVNDPASTQLDRLMAAATRAKTDPKANCTTSAQFFGEFLHALEDSYSHRDRNNKPYTAAWGLTHLGGGHATGGESPDYTYNHINYGLIGFTSWRVNEARTLQMERDVFARMALFRDKAARQQRFEDIERILVEFNAFPASGAHKPVDDSDDDNDVTAKLAILNNGLSALGYGGIDLRIDGKHGYSDTQGAANRIKAFGTLDYRDYPGTILPGGRTWIPEAAR